MGKGQGTHETFDRPDHVKVGSERAFGFVFAGFFSIVGGVRAWSGDDLTWVGVWFAAAAIVLLLALAAPRLLRPFNLVWFKFGLLLHRVVSPVIMGLMFFVVITPIGLMMRALGKRPLKLRFEPNLETYWIARTPPGPPPSSMTQQF
jgi:Saxitoxin biosynthesis operon protein SxtJ